MRVAWKDAIKQVAPRMPAISLCDIRLVYPARRRQPAREALRGITLSVAEGQHVALLGPNGSGKSTLIRVITGMAQPTSGQARIVDRTPAEARPALGVVFQNAGLDRHLTVWENLRDSATLYGLPPATARDVIADLLREMRLDDRRHALVKTLSGGLARRVDLCRALLSQPRVLILDEPTTGLDPVARREFLDQVESRRAAANRALTVLMSTHLTDEADRADRVIMLHEGRVVADDAPAALRQRMGERRVTVHDAAWSPSGSSLWRRTPGGWTRELGSNDEVVGLAAALAREGVPMSIAPPTLDDVFEQLTGARLINNRHGVDRAMEAA
jgi:ABC-2 type transport system ATP-binding protein